MTRSAKGSNETVERTPGAALGFTGPAVVTGEPIPGLVSVVIPTYNRANEVCAAIDSALAQTYDAIEVVVVDDGSTDATGALVAAFGPPVRYFHQANSGVSAARNRGLAECRGEFLALLDSDDGWEPWKLAAQVELLKRFPRVGMVCSDMMAVDENGTTLHPAYLRVMYGVHAETRLGAACRRHRLADIWSDAPAGVRDAAVLRGNIFAQMLLGNHVHTSTVVVRRSRLMLTGGFDESLRVSGEDYEFHLRTCAAGEVALLDASTTRYRVGADDQLTAAPHLVHIARNNLVAVERWLHAAPDGVVLDKRRIRHRLAQCHSWLGEEELRHGNIAAARRHICAGLWRRPMTLRSLQLLILASLPAAIGSRALELWRRLRGRSSARPRPGPGEGP